MTANKDALNLNRFNDFSLGLDKFFSELYSAAQFEDKYPPANIIRERTGFLTLELAVAGFSEDDISVTFKRNLLVVEGNKRAQEDLNRQYILRGIAGRNFKRNFVLADSIVVKNAVIKDGMLIITLEEIIPENDKPKVINVTRA
jgi:molecular chaperone IbpA